MGSELGGYSSSSSRCLYTLRPVRAMKSVVACRDATGPYSFPSMEVGSGHTCLLSCLKLLQSCRMWCVSCSASPQGHIGDGTTLSLEWRCLWKSPRPAATVTRAARRLKSAMPGLEMASPVGPWHHVHNSQMTRRDQCSRNGVRPMRTPQAGATPGSMSQRSPPSATGGPFVLSCGLKGQARKATGRRPSKVKETPDINIMQWNAEGVTNKKEELQQFLHKNSINICCIQETHLQEGKQFKIRGYQVFLNGRKGRSKGGVMTLVRNNINATEGKTLI